MLSNKDMNFNFMSHMILFIFNYIDMMMLRSSLIHWCIFVCHYLVKCY